MPTREELIQKAKERNKERNLKYRKVAKFFLNKGLKTKEATCFNSRISYFRGKFAFFSFSFNNLFFLRGKPL